jgi:hypothetical protein
MYLYIFLNYILVRNVVQSIQMLWTMDPILFPRATGTLLISEYQNSSIPSAGLWWQPKVRIVIGILGHDSASGSPWWKLASAVEDPMHNRCTKMCTARPNHLHGV